MKEIAGTNNKILEIDLSANKIEIIQVSEQDRKLFLGGKGLGLKLLSQRLTPGTDPLSPENVLVINTGVYMGSNVPCSARFNAVTKSPLTGIIVSSSCGGPFGMALKKAGYDGLILKGKAEVPSQIVISSKIEIKPASELWGLDTQETQDKLKLEKNSGALVIGPAGENKVLFANVVSGHRFLGRGGIGAVLGSKNIKAIVAIGQKIKLKPVKAQKLQSVKKLGTKYINQNYITSQKYRNFGTNSHVNICNKVGLLPVRNFSESFHLDAHKVSGELYAEKFTKRHKTCKPCSILCGHEGEFNGKVMAIPEYETTGLFGPNLEVFDPVAIAEWNDQCGKLGIDTITAGSVLAWAMEATEKGLIKSNLKFGSTKNIEQALNEIACRKGLGNDLANGTRALSEKYGGKEYAIHVKGLELAAYHPNGAFGQALGYAVANRGACHLSSAMFSIEGTLGYVKPHTTLSKAKFTDYFENLYAAINSMHGCQFTSYAYLLEPFIVKNTPEFLLGLVMQYLPNLAMVFLDIGIYSKSFESISGIKLTKKQMLKAGKRIHVLERLLNTREGISRKDDTLPQRFLKESQKKDRKNKMIPLHKMLDQYYKIKGYDKNGIPNTKTLKRLGLTNY
ncbi:MAG: aldehyde ferredoxin oxidoreductase family protein [Bacteroidales bacterium]|nr:aldehyde ferredoxin oxidoreductase family protein [Bacteroidales bacterium]